MGQVLPTTENKVICELRKLLVAGKVDVAKDVLDGWMEAAEHDLELHEKMADNLGDETLHLDAMENFARAAMELAAMHKSDDLDAIFEALGKCRVSLDAMTLFHDADQENRVLLLSQRAHAPRGCSGGEPWPPPSVLSS